MNLKRILTSVVGLPLVILVLMLGNKYIIDVFFAIIAVMSMHEYFNAFKSQEKAKPIYWLGYLACGLIGIIHIIPKEYIVYVIGIMIPSCILLLFLQVIISNMKYTINDIAITFFGICYIPLFIMFLSTITSGANGKIFIWIAIIAAWATDIFAYITGKTIGKHKFSQISPNKSIEGCIGGTIGAIVVTLIYIFAINNLLGMNINYIYIGIISFVLSLIGQIGDFSASSIKRYIGIKDFSNLLPGHGGMLDRIDSLMFIAPFAFFLLKLI